MNIRITFFTFLLLSSINSFAQETTKGDIKTEAVNTPKASVLIIPFEPRLYISDIDNQIATKNEMNFQDINAKFRAALDQNIFITLKQQYYTPISFYALSEDEAREDLSYIYNSIGYKYEVIPTEVEDQNKKSSLLNKFKKKEKEETYIDAGINNGEVVSQVDNREKYMKTVISNSELLATLNKKFQAEYYIFINELDIKRGLDVQNSGANKNDDRTIKVHYTIFNTTEVVASGAIIVFLDKNENDINKIVKTEFGIIAEKLVNSIAPKQN